MWNLLLAASALADPRLEGSPATPSAPPTGVEVVIAPPSAWPGTRLARVPGDPPFHAWPDKAETPHLVVDCTRRKLKVYVETTFPADYRGDSWDGWRAVGEVRFDLGPTEPIAFRTDLVEDQLHIIGGKAFLRKLVAYAQVEIGFTPFASPPTHSTFEIAGLRSVLGDITQSCAL
jgi:hypothetical protein